MLKWTTTTAAALVLCVWSAGAFAQAATRIQGEIVRLDGQKLSVRMATGAVNDVVLADQARIQRRTPITLEQIKPGVFLGTTAAPGPDGTLVASEVHVFPESMRGTGEGHRPFGNDNRSTMTNATVKDVRPTEMTGTVSAAPASAAGRRLSLTYQGGEKVVVVPANTPVVLSEPADRTALKPGEHVIVSATRGTDGSLQADRVSVGVNGSVPPI